MVIQCGCLGYDADGGPETTLSVGVALIVM